MLRVHGLDLSYFTGKLEAYLRAKGLPYERVEMDTRDFRRCARMTGVAQMPQLEFPDGQWLTDSTRIIAHFEMQAVSPAIYPEDPALCFIAHLLEDFGDEWLWRPAMHYRWSFAPDARLASERLARGMLRDVPLPLALRRWLIRRRQCRRFLRHDGVKRETAAAVEQVYLEVLDAMQVCLSSRHFLLGERPTQADFGFFGSMFRHFASDPTPAHIMRERAPAVLAWVDRLWQLTPEQFNGQPMPDTLACGFEPLLRLVCQDYLPYLDGNERALEVGARSLSWQSKGVVFNTPVHHYRVWCLQQLRQRYQALDRAARERVDAALRISSAESGAFAVSLLQRTAGAT
jgi:glutathione S-transferase